MGNDLQMIRPAAQEFSSFRNGFYVYLSSYRLEEFVDI